MARYASGKKSQAISDISGLRVPYTKLRTTWDGLRVSPEDFDPKQPQLTPAKNVVDATALFNPRPDTDPENVVVYIGFTQDWTIDPRLLPGVGVEGLGTVGFAANIDRDYIFDVTGVDGTGAIGTVIISDNEDVVVTGLAGTGAIGTETIENDANVVVTGVDGTGAIGTETIEADATVVVTGVAGTGAIGTVIVSDNEDVVVTGLAGTGAIGTETIENDAVPAGVAGTGAEVFETEIPEVGLAGTAIGTVIVSDNEEVVTGVSGSGAIGTVIVSDNEDVVVTGYRYSNGWFWCYRHSNSIR
jgi:hypothetical protein